ncbi:hypothetical protein N7507_006064 [Penicillium longicatenatum]|nr:hypothetical protein N7507_006064 [Penicillium longicatenatum]
MTGPVFFCARPGGGLTPMVPLDELPPTISIRGVPRTISPADTQGMTSCGMARPRAEPWAVEGTPIVAASNQNDLIELKSVLIKIISDNSLPLHHRGIIQNAMNRCSLRSIPVIEVTGPTTQAAAVPVSTNQGTGLSGNDQPAPIRRDQDQGLNRKKYCSYWIRHGECDYLQQGCMFKHEMPLEPRLIEELGLRDIPRWYREKFNVASLLHATYQRPQGQLSTVDRPHQKAIEFNEPSAAPHDRGSNAENANHRINNNGRFKTPRGAQNGKARGNGRTHNGNRNMNQAANAMHNTHGMSQMHTGTSNGMGQMHNVPRNMTPDNSTSPDSVISHLSMKTGAPDDLKKTTMMNSVSTNPAIIPVTSVAPPTRFGAGALGFHGYPVPHRVENNSMRHAASLSGRGSVKPQMNYLDEDTSSDSVSTCKSSKAAAMPKIPDVFCRRQSRRMYDFGCDGDVKKKLGANPDVLTPIEETVESDIDDTDVLEPLQFKSDILEAGVFQSDECQSVPVLSTMGALLKKLLSNSEGIDPHRVLFNFGPIGEDVIIPPKRQCPKTGTLIDTKNADVTPVPAMYKFGQNAMYDRVNKQ